jgi:MFS family permease
VGGFRLLFAVMTVLGLVVAGWALLAVPAVPPLSRTRQTVVDLARRITDPQFLRPTAALAGATAALSVGVGFLPVTGAAAGLGTVATGAAVSVLALTAALVQPRTGRALDAGRITTRGGLAAGLLLAAAGLGCAALPGLIGVLLAAVLIGTGTGLITPLGFAALAASTSPDRLGQTMGTAELGRELGDAGGPLLVAAIATTTALTYGYAALATLLAAFPLLGLAIARTRPHQP